MLDITQVDHLGLRVADIAVARRFYEQLGFAFVKDFGFDQGHPVILRHASGVTVNLLGPSRDAPGTNILMDAPEKYAGYTHVAFEVASIAATQKALEELGIAISAGPIRLSEDTVSIFIRDPDRSVIELTQHGLREPAAKGEPTADDSGYRSHP